MTLDNVRPPVSDDHGHFCRFYDDKQKYGLKKKKQKKTKIVECDVSNRAPLLWSDSPVQAHYGGAQRRRDGRVWKLRAVAI